jgi:hypothetical protein
LVLAADLKAPCFYFYRVNRESKAFAPSVHTRRRLEK